MSRGLRAVLVGLVVALGIAGPLLLASVAASGEPSGGLTWYRSFAQAQAAARAEGKLVLVASTRPGCGLCETFRNQTAPACRGELARVAVGYVYDITRPEDRSVDAALRANLPGAKLMPLVGFFTPDLAWVHGFWGRHDAGQFRADIATAARAVPRPTLARPVPPASRPARPPAPPPPASAPAAPRAPACPPPAPACPPPADTHDELCPGGRCGVPGATPFGGEDELCPGGVCRVPDAFAAPEPPRAAAPAFPPPAPAPAPVPAPAPARAPALAAPEVRRLAPPAGEPLPRAGAEAPPALATGPRPAWLPDVAAERRGLGTRLQGSPDGEAAQPVSRPGPSRAARPSPSAAGEPASERRPPTAPATTPAAPAPRATGAEPEAGPGAGSTRVARAQEAANAGRWGEVLRLCGGASEGRLAVLAAAAHRWSQDELERGLRQVLAGRHDEALRTLRAVESEMAGDADALDAARGIDALHTVRDLRRLSDPSGPLATALRRNKYEELRGSRWARLFTVQG